MFGKTRAAVFATATALTLAALPDNQADAQNLNLTATIQSGCTIATESLPFGDIDATNGGSTSTVNLNITGCSFSGSQATITVDTGANGAGANSLRQLKHATAADLIEYTLTESTAGGVVAPGASFLAGFDGQGGAILQFSASIAPAAVSGKTVGNYSDSVGITVSFALS
ncbi:MAG: spore coat protein U domain-containing protein [Pseudomonadota bacterium]